jgi:hypothetical protein
MAAEGVAGTRWDGVWPLFRLPARTSELRKIVAIDGKLGLDRKSGPNLP